MTAPEMTWSWYPGGERYEGTDDGDTVEAVWKSTRPDELVPMVWIGNGERSSVMVPAETAAPAAVVLAAMVRAFGRAEVVEWARTVQLDPVAACEVCNDCGDFCATCGAGDDRSDDGVEP